MKDLIIASNNKHKIKEIKEILGSKFDNIYSLSDKNIDIEIIEDGETFEENALIKARTICNLSGLCALADDSGLCVDSLDGAPGVYSARYAGEPCSDGANNALLLKNLKGSKDRKAHFVSAIALCFPSGEHLMARGSADGVILEDYRGEGGFGYDPLFLSDDLNITFAEASSSQKNSISHRKRALDNLLKNLEKLD